MNCSRFQLHIVGTSCGDGLDLEVAKELGFVPSSLSDFLASHHEVIGNLIGDDRVALVILVRSYEVTDPSRRGDKLAGSSLFNKVKVFCDTLKGNRVAIDVIEVGIHQRDKSREVISLARHDFLHCHFFIGVLLVAPWRKRSLLPLTAHAILVNLTFFRQELTR